MHTLGPWKVGKQRKIYAGHPTPVAQTLAIEGDYTTAKANAHLVAAAPDMFRVLVEAREVLWSAGNGDLVDEIDDVLALAEGTL